MSSTRVYPAERAAFGKRFRGADVALSLHDARAIAEKYLVAVEWKVQRTKSSRIDSGSWCWYRQRVISLSRDAGLPIVLHEIAHALCGEEVDHGLPFQVQYLELVQKEMGDYWYRRLRAQLRKHKTSGWRQL